MTTRRPLVLIGSQVQELPLADSLPVRLLEPVVAAGFNADVVHETGLTPVPMFVTTTDGDIVTAGVY